MHDFCFTIPYGLLLMCGGAIGYAKKGSTASLGGGVGTGLLLMLILAGYLSLQAFPIAGLLTWVMGQRYMQTAKIMPAGIVSGISFLMTAFYLYKVVTGGNHIPPKTE